MVPCTERAVWQAWPLWQGGRLPRRRTTRERRACSSSLKLLALSRWHLCWLLGGGLMFLEDIVFSARWRCQRVERKHNNSRGFYLDQYWGCQWTKNVVARSISTLRECLKGRAMSVTNPDQVSCAMSSTYVLCEYKVNHNQATQKALSLCIHLIPRQFSNSHVTSLVFICRSTWSCMVSPSSPFCI